MRSQPILGLFLSFCLPSMGHVAKSPPNSLQSRDHDHLSWVGKRADWNNFGETCVKYSFDETACTLTAHCLPEGKKDRVESTLDVNKCLAHFVMKGLPKDLQQKKTFFDWKIMGNEEFVKLDEPVGNICKDKRPCKMIGMEDKGSPELVCDRNPQLPLGYGGISLNSDGHLEC